MGYLRYGIRQMGSTRNFQKCQELPEKQKGKVANFLELWYCEAKTSDHFLVIPSYGLAELSCETNEQLKFWLASAFFSFRL